MHCVNDWADRQRSAIEGDEMAKIAATESMAEELFNGEFSPWTIEHYRHANAEAPDSYIKLMCLQAAEKNYEALGKLVEGFIRSFWYSKAYDYAAKELDNETQITKTID